MHRRRLRVARVTICAALLISTAAGPLQVGRAPVGEATGDEATEDEARTEELTRFLAALEQVRSGATESDAALLESGERLSTLHGRSDALDVARFYASLTREDRVQGLADEARFDDLRDGIVEAGHLGMEGDERWADLRDRTARALEELAREIETHADIAPRARTYSLLAWLALDRLEHDASLSDAERHEFGDRTRAHADLGLELFERTGQVTPRLEPLWVRARLARAEGDREGARAELSVLRGMSRSVGRDDYRERALLGLADLAADVGDVNAMDRLLAEVATFRDPRSSWALARGHAQRLLADDRAEAALAFLLEHPPEASTHEHEWRGLLASTYLRTGDVAGARREIDDLRGGEFPRLARARLALTEGRPDDVIEDLESDPSVASWSTRGRTEVDALLGEAQLDLGRPDLARRHLEVSIETARRRQLSQPEGAGSAVGEWLGLHTLVLLARAHVEAGDPLAAAVEIEEHQSRRLRRASDRVNAAEASAWAARFEGGLVTWVVGADGAVVVHVSPSGNALGAVLDVGRSEISSGVRRLRESALTGDEGRVRALVTELVEALLPERIRSRLEGLDPDDRTLFLLHGPLEKLPLVLLGWEGRDLDERLTPVVLPGLPSGDERVAAPLAVDARWWLMGSPLDPADGTVLLPGAGRELAHLARRHPDALLATGTAFVTSALTEALRGESPLHLATHLVPAPGEDDGRLAPVGLLLSGGEVLGARTVLELGPCLPLVVLSACETGGGRTIDGEGIHGVGRAFLESGTRDVLVTLWPVEDAASQRMSLWFHSALAEGLVPSRAARKARRALRQEGANMADWGAFRLMGRD